MEATLDSTVRTVGGPIRDVVVRCLTTQCRIVVLYHPSYYLERDPDLRDEAQLAIGNAVVEALQPIFQTYPELRMPFGSPGVQVSREAPLGTGLEPPLGTIFEDAGILAGLFMLSKAAQTTD